MRVIVLGCGVAGAFTSYFLLRRGVNTVVVCRDYGSTVRAAGVVSVQLNDELEVRLALRSIDIYRSLMNRYGSSFGITGTGFLSIGSEDDVYDEAELLRRMGVKHRLLSYSELRDAYPFLTVYEDEVGLYSYPDMSMEPREMISSLMGVLRRMGAEIIDGNVEGLETNVEKTLWARVNGDILKGDTYVLALGPALKEVLEGSGVRLPTIILRCPAFRFRMNLGSSMPAMEDLLNNSYWKPSFNSTIVGGGYNAEHVKTVMDSFSPPTRDELLYALRLLRNRFRADPQLVEGWCGACSLTPDFRPIAGKINGNTYVLEGLRGYGLMFGPALGEALADMIAGEKPNIDVSRLEPGRLKIRFLR